MKTAPRLALVVLIALLPPLARAQERPLELRRVFTAGDRWVRDEDLTLQLSFSISHAGQVLQTVQQSSRKLRKCEVSVLEVAGGKLAAVRAVYAAEPECGDTEQTGTDAPQRKPCGLAGQTVIVRRQAAGPPAIECAGQLGPEEQAELNELLDPSDGFLPRKAVKPGESWDAEESAVRQALDLGPEDRGTLRLKLDSVREVDGRQTAVLVAAVTLQQKQEGLTIGSKLEGVLLIDVATGHILGLTLQGPLTIGGALLQADEDGNEVRLEIAGTGKLALVNTAHRVAPGQAATPAPAVAAPAAAEGVQRQGKASFTPPPGWKVARYQNGALLTPPQHGADADLQVLIMLPLAATGTPAEGLRQSWDDACATLGAEKTRTVEGTPYSEKQGGRSFRGWEYLRGEGTVRSGGQDFYMNLMVIKLADRFERAAVYGKDKAWRGVYPSYHDPRLYHAVQELLFSLSFDDCPAPAAPPGGLRGEGIVGAWGGVIYTFGEIRQGWAIFLDNGQALFSSTFPRAGLHGLNSRIEAELYQREWGTWTWDGASGSIKLPYTEVLVRPSGPDLKLNTLQKDRVFQRLPSVDGARFDGTWGFEAQPGDPAAGKSITFTADGRYTDAGAITILNHLYPLVEPPGSGTYEVQDHTMTLRCSDGRVYRIAVTGTGYTPGETRPSRLVLSANEDVLVRR